MDASLQRAAAECLGSDGSLGPILVRRTISVGVTRVFRNHIDVWVYATVLRQIDAGGYAQAPLAPATHVTDSRGCTKRNQVTGRDLNAVGHIEIGMMNVVIPSR